MLVLHQPQVAILPLYAFYPGELASGKPGYNPTLMHAWGTGAGILCLVLAIVATWRRNKTTAIILMVFFLMSTLISCARVIHGAQSSP
jgi:predicted membrane channel-forming protein YqfA (hemolysin III family)